MRIQIVALLLAVLAAAQGSARAQANSGIKPPASSELVGPLPVTVVNLPDTLKVSGTVDVASLPLDASGNLRVAIVRPSPAGGHATQLHGEESEPPLYVYIPAGVVLTDWVFGGPFGPGPCFPQVTDSSGLWSQKEE